MIDPKQGVPYESRMEPIERHLTESPRPLPPTKDLGFGQFFSDHWFSSRFSADLGWHTSRIAPYGPIQLDPAASVLHYGQALFEGMKAFRQPDGRIALFRPDFNYNRLVDGADRLCLVPPPPDLFMEGVKQLVAVEQRWVPQDENCSLYIRPTLIGTEPFLGVRPSREVMFFVLCSPVGSYYSSGPAPVRIWVEDKALRAAPGGLGATKAGANYAASLQAGLKAKERGYAQVLWLDVERQGIEEVGTMNVFFVFKNEIVTPALNGSILPGATRDSAIRLLNHQGLNVTERRITMTEVLERLQEGDLLEAFGTGTAAVISPIGELAYQGRSYVLPQAANGPVASELARTIAGIQRGTLPDPFGWVVPVGEF